MVFDCSNKPNQGNNEEQDANSDSHSNHSKTRDQSESDAPCRCADQQKADHNIEEVQDAQGVLGAGEPTTNHDGRVCPAFQAEGNRLNEPGRKGQNICWKMTQLRLVTLHLPA